MKTRSFTCVRCNNEATRYASVTRDICQPCMLEHGREAEYAVSISGIAIKNGVLERAKGKLCVDCGGEAASNDHRDYTKPLEVEPVCQSCNVLRGPGLDSKMREFPKITIGKNVGISLAERILRREGKKMHGK